MFVVREKMQKYLEVREDHQKDILLQKLAKEKEEKEFREKQAQVMACRVHSQLAKVESLISL